MKKLFFLGFIALMTVACGNKADKKADNEANKTEEPKKEEAKSDASAKETITGTWVMSTVNGEAMPAEVPTFEVTFSADGSVNTSDGKPGKWEIKEKDGKNFLVMTSNQVEENEIKTLDAKTLIILDKGTEIAFAKK
jgi:hypothetical protein